MSTEDGPGIRTTAFFKGCSLRCAWCHNPESISPKLQVQWLEGRCIGCGSCLEVCGEGALQKKPEGMAIDRDRCSACGLCIEACPAAALEMLGKIWSVDGLTAEVLKDRAYYGDSGGVTLGGGEPALQPRFAAALLAKLKSEGVHTALDTCGMCAPGILESLLPQTDMVLYDLKEIDPERHRRCTGFSNEKILANAETVRESMERQNQPRALWIRTPVIPGATASTETIRGIGNFIRARLDGFVSRWELCAFNNLCRDKYRRLGLKWEFEKTELLTRPLMEELAEEARRSVDRSEIVHWSGMVK